MNIPKEIAALNRHELEVYTADLAKTCARLGQESVRQAELTAYTLDEVWRIVTANSGKPLSDGILDEVRRLLNFHADQSGKE